MRKKVVASIMAVIMTALVLSQSAMAGTGLSDLGDLLSDAAESISDAADRAGDALSGAAGKAGDALSGAAGKAGDTLSGAAGKAGDFVSDTFKGKDTDDPGVIEQVSEILSGFASQAGEVVSRWGEYAGRTTDRIKESLGKAGVTVSVTAEQLGNATAREAADLTEKAGEAMDRVIDAVSGAGDFVVDQGGHVVDLAEVGVGHVKSASHEALRILQEKGDDLMRIAEAAVADIDLSNQENWEKAGEIVQEAIEKAITDGLLDIVFTDPETARIVTQIVFKTMMYGYQYSNDQITLGEYTAVMSEMLIREGLPAGVSFIVSLLPIRVPYADTLAKEAAYYLISIAYGDESGEEIEEEEKVLIDELSLMEKGE